MDSMCLQHNGYVRAETLQMLKLIYLTLSILKKRKSSSKVPFTKGGFGKFFSMGFTLSYTPGLAWTIKYILHDVRLAVTFWQRRW